VVASPRLPKGSFLIAVAAPVSNDVWAVGVDSSSSNALIEHWNGVSWSIVSSPAFTSQSATAISADSSTDVWTVGSFGAGTAALHWNGVTWSQVPHRAPALRRSLSGSGALRDQCLGRRGGARRPHWRIFRPSDSVG
jgi:hypothetical protein